MRPGHHRWAENDTYDAGPDIGHRNKLEPLAKHIGDGLYRGDMVAPDVLNWMFGRQALMQREMARARAISMLADDGSGGGRAGLDLGATAYSRGNGGLWAFYFNGTSNVQADLRYPGGIWLNDIEIVMPSPASVTGLDADCDDGNVRRIVISGNTDLIRHASGLVGNPYSSATFSGGAPGANWQCIGCDRNTAGGADAFWLIGDDGATGNGLLYSATGSVFSPVAGFPTLVGTALRGIFHSCHPSGALGPNDPGNPVWLVLTDTIALRSSNGSTWNQEPHGIGGGAGSMGPRSAAYSRTARRWVVMCGGTALGDIAYSDDNGEDWLTLDGALAGASGSDAQIVCDGYGTFIASDARDCWVSTDDGLTWTKFGWPLNPNTLNRSEMLGVAHDVLANVNQTPAFDGFFSYLMHDQSTGALHPYTGLRS